MSSATISVRMSAIAVTAVRGDHMVKRSLRTDRLTFLEFEEWERHADGTRTGVFMIVEEAPEHRVLVEAVTS